MHAVTGLLCLLPSQATKDAVVHHKTADDGLSEQEDAADAEQSSSLMVVLKEPLECPMPPDEQHRWDRLVEYDILDTVRWHLQRFSGHQLSSIAPSMCSCVLSMHSTFVGAHAVQVVADTHCNIILVLKAVPASPRTFVQIHVLCNTAWHGISLPMVSCSRKSNNHLPTAVPAGTRRSL